MFTIFVITCPTSGWKDFKDCMAFLSILLKTVKMGCSESDILSISIVHSYSSPDRRDVGPFQGL